MGTSALQWGPVYYNGKQHIVISLGTGTVVLGTSKYFLMRANIILLKKPSAIFFGRSSSEDQNFSLKGL